MLAAKVCSSKRGLTTARERVRYEDVKRASAEVERGKTDTPIPRLPEAMRPDETDPFPNSGATLPAPRQPHRLFQRKFLRQHRDTFTGPDAERSVWK